jgi:hypothetical protein
LVSSRVKMSVEEDFLRRRRHCNNESAAMYGMNACRIAIFAAGSTRARGMPHILVPGPALGERLGRDGRNHRHASLLFIAAFHPSRDRAPSGPDRRHRGGEPAGRRRVAIRRRVFDVLRNYQPLRTSAFVRHVECGFGRTTAACNNHQISSPGQRRWAGSWSSAAFVFSSALRHTPRISIKASRARVCLPIAAPRVIAASAALPRDASASRCLCI